MSTPDLVVVYFKLGLMAWLVFGLVVVWLWWSGWWELLRLKRARVDPRAVRNRASRVGVDPNVAQHVIRAEFLRIKYVLAPDWFVILHVGPLEGLLGQAFIVPSVRSGEISIDPMRHTTLEGVRHTITHELVHLLLEPVNRYRSAVLDGFGSGPSESEVWRMSIEEGVENVTLAILAALESGMKQRGL